MNTKPLVSVVMPVYNGGFYLAEAIKSILGQSYSHFEFIILNDGSTDDSLSIIQAFDDPRIKVFSSFENKGIIHQLNKGLALACGEYIARMDADDISLPQRFEKQVAFLQQHPDYAIVGGQVERINEAGKFLGIRSSLPCDYSALRARALFLCPFSHPSIMAQTAVIQAFTYSPKVAAEDYYLWVRILEKHKAANLPDTLIYYREHLQNNTFAKTNWYLDSVVLIFKESLRQIGYAATDQELDTLRCISAFHRKAVSRQKLQACLHTLKKVEKYCVEKNIYTKKIIKKVMAEVWLKTCYRSIVQGGQGVRDYYLSPYVQWNDGLVPHLKLIIRRILGKKRSSP